MTDKQCISCEVTLISPENWYPSFVGKNHYKCKECYDLTRNLNRIKKDGLTIGRIAAIMSSKARQAYTEYSPTGHIYIVSNPAWPEWFKVGSSFSAENRKNSYQTSSPYRDYELEYKIKTQDRLTTEAKVHKELTALDIPRKNEWFKPESIDQLIGVIDANA